MRLHIPKFHLLAVLIACVSLLCTQRVQAQTVQSGLQRLKAKNASTRAVGAGILEELGPKAASAVPDLIVALKVSDAEVRIAVADALKAIGAQLTTGLKDPASEVRFAAADTLGHLGLPASAALPALVIALKDPDEDVRTYVSLAITRMAPKAAFAVPNLIEALSDKHWKVQSNAEYALGLIGVLAASALPDLTKALKDSNPVVRDFASTNIQRIAVALVDQKKKLSLPVLQKASSDLERANKIIAALILRSEEFKDTVKDIAPRLLMEQKQLEEEWKSRPS